MRAGAVLVHIEAHTVFMTDGHFACLANSRVLFASRLDVCVPGSQHGSVSLYQYDTSLVVCCIDGTIVCGILLCCRRHATMLITKIF